MSIRDPSTIAELIGSIGVVATLVYLAIQIRANTRATKASAGFEATHSWASLNEHMLGQPDELLEIFVGMFTEEYEASKLSDVQHLRLTLLWRTMFQKLEGQYYLFKFGLLDPGLWAQRSSIGSGVIRVSHIAAWWEGEKAANTFSSEFVRVIKKRLQWTLGG